MNPFYFGDSNQPLFGIDHPPRGSAAQARGVVLCCPIGQEYMRSHRAYRTLANLLSRRGIHVFRFDYFGTGDSSGESDAGSPSIWQANIATAIDELRESAAIDRVSLVGLRFGAALAAQAAAGRDDVERLVLWDPIISGAAYVHEMMAVADPPGVEGLEPGTVGVLGFPLTNTMRGEMEKIDLLELSALSPPHVSILVSSENDEARGLETSLHGRGVDASYRCIPSAGNWNEVDNFGGALVPQEIIQGVVASLCEGLS
jgi:pimeloyl-ACP methyl ester carboxylesterase